MQKNTSAKWLMLLLMLAAFSVTFMTRFVWSPVSGNVQELLGLSNTAAGSFMSAFFIGYVITQIPGGVLADRVGVKYILSVGVLVTGLASVGMSFISTYTQGFIIRIITGLGAGVVMSCCTKIISEYFEQKDRGIAFGILLTGPTLGLTIANKLGAWLLITYNWQTAFRIIGYIAIAIAVLVFAAVRNVRKTGNAEKVTLLSGIKAVFTTRNLITICLAGFFYMFLNLGVSTWANSYLANVGFDTVTAASIMSLYSIGGIIGSLLTGVIVKKFNLSVKYYLIGVYVALIITTILFGFQTNLTVLNIVGFIYGFITYLPNAHLNAQITKYAPEGMSASVMGVQNCIFQLASIISPMVVGWTVDVTGAFQTCWFTLAAVVAVGIIFLSLVKEER